MTQNFKLAVAGQPEGPQPKRIELALEESGGRITVRCTEGGFFLDILENGDIHIIAADHIIGRHPVVYCTARGYADWPEYDEKSRTRAAAKRERPGD